MKHRLGLLAADIIQFRQRFQNRPRADPHLRFDPRIIEHRHE